VDDTAVGGCRGLGSRLRLGLSLEGREAGAVDVRDAEVGAEGEEFKACFVADSGGGAGDENDLVVESGGHFCCAV